MVLPMVTLVPAEAGGARPPRHGAAASRHHECSNLGITMASETLCTLYPRQYIIHYFNIYTFIFCKVHIDIYSNV